ncbi:MAG: hypothetical protein M3370_08250 [Actinomycetota bacterium]|nr:hypothetical protein [Actinomycetota bacterium]
MRRSALVLLVPLVLAGLLAPAAPAAAQGDSFVECVDFSPQSVREACEQAVPIECRGPSVAGEDFDACLRREGTSPAAVREALDAAYTVEGIPVGGVDTGRGGAAAAPAIEGPWRAIPWLLVATLGLAGAVVWRRRPGG